MISYIYEFCKILFSWWLQQNGKRVMEIIKDYNYLMINKQKSIPFMINCWLLLFYVFNFKIIFKMKVSNLLLLLIININEKLCTFLNKNHSMVWRSSKHIPSCTPTKVSSCYGWCNLHTFNMEPCHNQFKIHGKYNFHHMHRRENSHNPPFSASNLEPTTCFTSSSFWIGLRPTPTLESMPLTSPFLSLVGSRSSSYSTWNRASIMRQFSPEWVEWTLWVKGSDDPISLVYIQPLKNNITQTEV